MDIVRDFLDPRASRALACSDHKQRIRIRPRECEGKICRFRMSIFNNWFHWDGSDDFNRGVLELPGKAQGEERLSCLVRCEDKSDANEYFHKVLRSVRSTVLRLSLDSCMQNFGRDSGELEFIQGLTLSDLQQPLPNDLPPNLDFSRMPDRTVLRAKISGAEFTELQFMRNGRSISLLNIEEGGCRRIAHNLAPMIPRRLFGLCILTSPHHIILSCFTNMSVEFSLENV